MNTGKLLAAALASAVLLAACAARGGESPKQPAASVAATPEARQGRRPFEIFPAGRPLPTEGFDNPPEAPFRPGDDVIRLDQMRKFYGPPGEFGYYIDGADYGFKSLSFILTETHPGGGPNLHTHETEEAHILLEGRVTYIVGGSRFTVEGPYITRVPAGVPHTFVNAGPEPFNLIAVFPDGRPDYAKGDLGPNPLISKSQR
ncbi:MAG TPA: cupin domain-containing protein [Pyrinomonadaceae bacterium]|nr:cupin domain-containing protein [Pyrinomonadaceae bacterium]